MLTLGKTHIVTNGDQTDTIYDLMSQGKSFADALRTRTFEPDGPNYTPVSYTHLLFAKQFFCRKLYLVQGRCPKKRACIAA